MFEIEYTTDTMYWDYGDMNGKLEKILNGA